MLGQQLFPMGVERREFDRGLLRPARQGGDPMKTKCPWCQSPVLKSGPRGFPWQYDSSENDALKIEVSGLKSQIELMANAINTAVDVLEKLANEDESL